MPKTKTKKKAANKKVILVRRVTCDTGFSPDPLDYPSSMSGYERDSLAAEAQLADERRRKRALRLLKP